MNRLRTLALAPLLGALTVSASFASAWPGSPTGTSIGTGLSSLEISGVVWDNPTGKLYAVDDEGTLVRMERDGLSTVTWPVAGSPDMEAIADTGSTFYLYVGVEYDSTSGTAKILQIPSYSMPAGGTTLTPTMSWDLPFADLPVDATHGLEGLTFVPNGHHPYTNSSSGGVFYASTQQDGSITVFNVDLSTSGSVPAALDTFTPDATQTDISDLYYSAATRTLFVLYDTANKVIEIDTSTRAYEKIATYTLPSTPANQEGITTLPQCPGANTQIYLGNDSGGVYNFATFPQLCATTYASTGDATINPASPTTNYGSATTLTADTSPTLSFLYKFSSTASSGAIARARLRFYVTDGTTASPNACGTTNSWSQGTVTWNTAPSCSGSSFGGGGNSNGNEWYSYSLTSQLATYSSYRFTGASTNDFITKSSEATPSDQRPQLIVWTGAVP
jgi:hypothetical protein